MLLSIDPGADAGWARFSDAGKLVACGLNEGAIHAGTSRAVIERPMIYPGGRQKARPADVITLAVRAGEWGGRVESFLSITPEYVEPSTWKGQVPKDVHQLRIWARLAPDEQELVATAGRGVSASKRHNIVDAVGIGLWALGRKA